eukprot:5447721-Amphidinium_carterae.2
MAVCPSQLRLLRSLPKPVLPLRTCCQHQEQHPKESNAFSRNRSSPNYHNTLKITTELNT